MSRIERTGPSELGYCNNCGNIGHLHGHNRNSFGVVRGYTNHIIPSTTSGILPGTAEPLVSSCNHCSSSTTSAPFQHLTTPSPSIPAPFFSHHPAAQSRLASPELPRFLHKRRFKSACTIHKLKPFLSSPLLSKPIYQTAAYRQTHPPHCPDHKARSPSLALSAPTTAPRPISETGPC